MRTRQSLNGWWDYRIGEGRWTKIRVPCSARPVGRSEYALDFKAAPHRRAFLVLEGITYAAEVTLNGKKLGVDRHDLWGDQGRTLTLRDTGNGYHVLFYWLTVEE